MDYDRIFMMRYNLDPEIDEQFYINNFVNIYRDIFDIEYFTIGLEKLDNCGDATNPHIHMVFQAKDKKGNNIANYRKRLSAYWKSVEEKRSGNGLYSLVKVEADDYFRLFRYPLKQGGNQFDSQMVKLPPDFDLEEQRKLAYQEWSSGIKYNKEKKIRSQQKESTYDKLDAYLKTLEITGTRSIQLGVVAYYKENKLACNFKTMQGYVNTYRLLNGMMSDEEALSYMDKQN